MYSNYRFLKETLDGIHYKGYPLSKMAATEIIGYAYRQSKVRWFMNAAIRMFYIDNVSRQISTEMKNKVVDTLYSILIPRRDYYRLVNAAMKKNKRHECGLVDFVETRRRFSVSLNLWLRAGLVLKSTTSKNNLAIGDLFALFLILVRVISQIKNVDSISMRSTPGSYVAFNSSFGLEAYVTQYFKNKGVSTYSLQHGMYTLYKNDIPLDAINYDNIVADHMLCWGEYTRQQLVEYGIDEERLLLAGNPLYSNYNREIVPGSFHKCVVYLARNKYEDGNKQLIQMLTKCLPNTKFFIKPHPSLDLKKYRPLMNNENIELLETTQSVAEIASSGLADFVITYNTTVLYEFIRFGVLCFSYVYKGDGSVVLEPFNNCEKLKAGIMKYKEYAEDEFDKRLEEFSMYTIGTEEMHETYNV